MVIGRPIYVPHVAVLVLRFDEQGKYRGGNGQTGSRADWQEI